MSPSVGFNAGLAIVRGE